MIVLFIKDLDFNFQVNIKIFVGLFLRLYYRMLIKL